MDTLDILRLREIRSKDYHNLGDNYNKYLNSLHWKTVKLLVDGEVTDISEIDEMQADVHADWDQIVSEMVNDWSWLED